MAREFRAPPTALPGSGPRSTTGLQLGATRTCRRPHRDLLTQHPAALSAGKLAFALPVEACFISIEG
jgi:hypothetical protein